jgi:arginyl-tRNA synthetase
MNYIEKAVSEIKTLLTEKYIADFCENPNDFNVEIPAEKQYGDFAANIAMLNAKKLKQPPRKIAEKLIENITLTNTYFEKVEVAGAGFINFSLSQKWFSDILLNIDAEKEQYGKTEYGKGKRILVEFVSANPTGPMHIGNARGGAIGDCLAAVFEWAGFYVEREFYINDAGNQIEKFANSLETRYLQIFDNSIEMSEDMYQGADIIEHAANFSKEYGDEFFKADSDKRKKVLVDYALPKNIQGLETDLKKYRIEYDTWYKESVLHNNGETERVVKALTDKGFTYEN